MSSSDRGRDDAPGTHRDPVPAVTPTGGADAYANWLERMRRARARQAAITRNLYTWPNYKNWADQVRDSWAASDASAAAHAAGKPKK
ncbi:MAG TPA: hypothetical protein VGZ05_09695 [Steroidobacteraceae bacterium]|jgi:hypothetical protein|nr:hypothetical protein [Steroidobacteraceae bacterium]